MPVQNDMLKYIKNEKDVFIILLRTDVDLTRFLRTVQSCDAEGTLHSAEGDILNLKSQLTEYIFLAASTRPHFLSKGTVCCQNPNDYRIIHEFLIFDSERR